MSELFGKLSEKLSGLSESPPSKPGEKSTVHKLDLQHATRDQLVEFAKRQHNHIKQIESHYKALKAKTAEEKNHIAQQELLIPTLQQRIRELEQEVMLYSAELSAMKSTRDDGSSDDENDNAFFAQSAVKRLADLRGQFIEEDVCVLYQNMPFIHLESTLSETARRVQPANWFASQNNNGKAIDGWPIIQLNWN